MVEKQFDGESGAVAARFRLPAEVEADTVFVVGEFNDWSTSRDAMRREDGAFVAEVELEPGRAYRFRYLLDGNRWENDWAADRYEPNEFGGNDSVIDLTDYSAWAPGPNRPHPTRQQRGTTRTNAAN